MTPPGQERRRQRQAARDARLYADRQPRVIEWVPAPEEITADRRQENLARSTAIRAALRSYLAGGTAPPGHRPEEGPATMEVTADAFPARRPDPLDVAARV